MADHEVHILVANPHVAETTNLAEYFTAMGYRGVAVTDVDKIKSTLLNGQFALTFIDREFLTELGEELFEWSDEVSTDVVVMSSAPTVESVIDVLRMGVFDCLIRPFDLHELTRVVTRVLERQGIEKRKTVCINTDNKGGFDQTCNEEAVLSGGDGVIRGK